MAAAGARAQKPVGSAAWIAAEKENMAELVEQEMEEVEYPVRHEMDWLNEHMAEIFSRDQANFTNVFKTPGKMRGKTPRTARKRNVVEESRVPLSEIFSSTQKQAGNKASPSPFIHRVISKTASTAASASASPRPKGTEKGTQPQYPDLSQNLNSFQKYNTDSGYHGMDDDDMVFSDTQPATQPDTQVSTQPMEVEEQVEEPAPSNNQVNFSMSLQTAEDSFHSAQENVRARGETVEPMNVAPDATQDQTATPRKAIPKKAESEPESSSTPTPKTQPQSKATRSKQNQPAEAAASEEPETHDEFSSKPQLSPKKPISTKSTLIHEPQDQDTEPEDNGKEDTVMDFDDIGSPSDNSTPERLPVRKSSLSFASLPAREPLTKSIGGPRLSRTSHIDLPKLSGTGRLSYLGRQTGGHKMPQVASENDAGGADSMDVDGEKDISSNMDAEQASKLHSTKSTQSLHERISMLGKAQASRAKKSIAASAAGLGTASQVAYPDLSVAKPDARNESSSSKTRDTPPTSERATAREDDWIPRPTLQKSKTADVMENLDATKDSSVGKKDTSPVEEKQSAEPERPKSSYSIFSSPRPQGHQQSASTSIINAEASTTPTGSPRRYDGPLSASKMRLQSIMKSAKGLFTSTGSSAKIEMSSPEQPRFHPKEPTNAEQHHDEDNSQQRRSRDISSTPRQEGRRTRSSTEREEKQRQRELEERQREESRQEKAREQERQRALHLKAAQDKSSVEPEERTTYKSSQSLRQPSREPESAHEASRIAVPQSKQNDRRPKPTREPMQKPKPQPVSVRVGSTLSRGMALASSTSTASIQESNAPASTPASKQTGLKKKPSNNSLHTTSSTSSFKSSVSSQPQAQRKAQLASERKREQEERKREQEEKKREQEERRREQEEREARKREEQRREQERKRALQLQQQEARRQAESRAEAERERREQSAQGDPKRAANKQAIENWRMENARRQDPARPASRLGSAQPYSRSVNPPPANPAKPPKRNMDEDAGHRPAVSKPSNVQPSGEYKRRKTEDEHSQMQQQAVRPPMPRPIRQPSTIRKPSIFGQSSIQTGSSILKAGQPQRPGPGHPVDMSKLAHGKIPFAEPGHAPPPAAHRAPAQSSTQRTPGPSKPSPKYPNGENIHLPEIATDSEDEDDSDSEMFPVPQWAQPKELEGLLRQQDGMEVDSIFGPIAPFSLEETFKGDKKIKKFRERTSSAHWSGPDGLTQEEIRRDLADRQRLRLNGGWSFNG